MSTLPARRRLDEFDLVTPAAADFVVGYRPGAKGIRFTIGAKAEGAGVEPAFPEGSTH